jgi:hypothetical protein
MENQLPVSEDSTIGHDKGTIAAPSDEQTLDSEQKNLHWEKLTSMNGKSYEVGRIKPLDGMKGTQRVKDPDGMTCYVDWPITTGWVSITDAVKKKTGIIRYALIKLGAGHYYDYRLRFDCTESYHYYFTDGTGEVYSCNVWITGQHSVDYDSKKPNIVLVAGQ